MTPAAEASRFVGIGLLLILGCLGLGELLLRRIEKRRQRGIRRSLK